VCHERGLCRSGNNLIASWPYPSTGWTLQQNNNLTLPANWTASGGVTTSEENGNPKNNLNC
jgi:hypothetical protein